MAKRHSEFIVVKPSVSVKIQLDIARREGIGFKAANERQQVVFCRSTCRQF